MTDKILSFKDEMDAIHVPAEKLDAIIFKTIQEHNPPRKRLLRNKFIYGVSAAVVSIGLFMGSTTVSPVMANIASKLPIIGSVFSESTDKGLAKVSNLGLTQIIGQSETIDGDTVTIDEIFYDGVRLTVSYAVQSETTLGLQKFKSIDPTFTINGRPLSYGGGAITTEVTPTYLTGIVEIFAFDTLPKDFNLGVSFEENADKIWAFDVPTIAQNAIEIVEINHTQTIGGVTLNIPDVKISAGGIHFKFTSSAEEDNNFTALLDFKVVDDTGKEVIGHSGVSISEIRAGFEYSSGNRLFDPVDDRVKEITVTPYLILPTDGGSVSVDADGIEHFLKFKPFRNGDMKFAPFTIKLP